MKGLKYTEQQKRMLNKLKRQIKRCNELIQKYQAIKSGSRPSKPSMRAGAKGSK
jgi:hypothetical protein